MGQGGTSVTWTGFRSCKAAEKIIASWDTLTPTLYPEPSEYATGWDKANTSQKEAAQTSYVKEPLSVREGPQARAKKFDYAQRKRNAADPHDEAVKTAYLEAFKRLEIESTQWKISGMEKHGTALFLRDTLALSSIAESFQRDVCHIDGTDMSGHVTLSFADAQEVIAKGWGERHRLSGTRWFHLGYTMVYIPNNVAEIEVFAKIFRAGVGYMRNA